MTVFNIRMLLVMVTIGSIISCKPTADLSDTIEHSSEHIANEDTMQTFAESGPEFVYEPKKYQAEETRKHDLLHTRLEVAFDWEKQRLSGKATLELKPYFHPQKTLVLDAKNFDIHRVAMISAKDTLPLNHQYDNALLTIDLGKFFTRKEKYLAFIDYTAKPNEREAGGSAAITSDKGLYFINPLGKEINKPRQIWTQGETESNSFWFPTIDAPNERTTQEMYITVEKELTTLSNGILVSSRENEDDTRTDYWKMDLPHAPYLFMMAVGDYAIVEDSWQDLEVNYYVEPEYEPYAKAIFGHTPEMMTFFSNLLDYPFPWPKYAQVVVRDFVSGAMENTTASVFMEGLQIDNRELLDYHWDGIIAHELFHQWIGNLLTCESWANLPLNEAFANYSEYLWNEYKYGIEEAEYHNLQELRKYLNEARDKKVDLIRFYYDDREDMFDSHSYAKGGRILHMLRKYLGDEAFFAGLQHYVKVNAFRDVEIHDLRLAFEEVSGEDLNWFFNQWFLAAGHPRLQVQATYDSGAYVVNARQMQDLDKFPMYKLPLQMQIFAEGRIDTIRVIMDRPNQEWVFYYNKKPELMIFDSDHQLVAEVDHQKSDSEWIAQYRQAPGFTSRFLAIEQLSQEPVTHKKILIEALKDSSEHIREKVLRALSDVSELDSASLRPMLVDIAQNDRKSLVRAEALSLLSDLSWHGDYSVFESALQDSSYAVLGIALYSLAQSDSEEVLKIVEGFEEENNINIVFPVANFYARASLDKYGWYKNKIAAMSGSDLWYMLQFFGEYLMNSSLEDQQKGLKLLEEKARNSQLYYVRLAAYQAMGLLDKIDNVEQVRENIRASETDSRLNEIYNNME